MAWKSQGKVTVTTAGTPVQVTTTRTVAQSVMVQALAANTGLIYVGLSTLNKSTGVGVLGIIPIPTTNIIGSVSASIPLAPAGINLADLWIDSTVNGEGVIISYTEQ
jgi:hypothetical protein